MLTRCKTLGCYIVNGGFGTHTFVNLNGSSVIDYYIASASLFSYVSNCDVLQLSESSHFPLHLTLNVVKDLNRTPTNTYFKSSYV